MKARSLLMLAAVAAFGIGLAGCSTVSKLNPFHKDANKVRAAEGERIPLIAFNQKLEVADAGHWSVSDLDGLVPAFEKGCGAGTRQTDGEPFTYLDPATGRDITAAYATAFFRATLEDDAGARAYLGRGFPDDLVTVEHHE